LAQPLLCIGCCLSTLKEGKVEATTSSGSLAYFFNNEKITQILLCLIVLGIPLAAKADETRTPVTDVVATCNYADIKGTYGIRIVDAKYIAYLCKNNYEACRKLISTDMLGIDEFQIFEHWACPCARLFWHREA
jgi:hypothetical protein